MKLLSILERKLRWLAVEHMPVYVVAAQGILYVWGLITPESHYWFTLDPAAIFLGREYWRLITFLFVIPGQNPIFAFFYLYLLYVYGMALENAWGSFSFTVFYALGAIGTLAAGLFFGSADGSFFLNVSLFLAFAALFPDMTLYLFFVIPVKVKWLAIVTWAYFGYSFFILPASGKAAIVVSLLNYIVFFLKDHLLYLKEALERFHHRRRLRDFQQ